VSVALLSNACLDAEVADPEIIAVHPAWVAGGTSAEVEIQGRQFVRRWRVELDRSAPPEPVGEWIVNVGGRELHPPAVLWQSREKLRVQIPADLPEGVHPIGVRSPIGKSAYLEAALTVGGAAPDATAPYSPPPDAATTHPVLPDAANAHPTVPDAATPDAATPDAATPDAVSPEPPDAAGPTAIPDSGTSPPDTAPALRPLCDPLAFGAPQQVIISNFDSTAYMYAPAFTSDGLTLFFAAYQNNSEEMYWAPRTAGSLLFEPATAVNLNTAFNEGTPHLSADGQTLYFSSNRTPAVGARDLWWATRTTGAGFTFAAPQLLAGTNTANNELLPALTPDELTLYFASDRPGAGGTDIWVAERSDRALNFGAPVALAALNTAFEETSPHLSRDGRTLYFCSTRGGNLDIYAATRERVTDSFGPPVILAALSSTAIELDPATSPDDTELFFSSGRSGRARLWRSTRICP
jgi:hypothetical protein